MASFYTSGKDRSGQPRRLDRMESRVDLHAMTWDTKPSGCASPTACCGTGGAKSHASIYAVRTSTAANG